MAFRPVPVFVPVFASPINDGFWNMNNNLYVSLDRKLIYFGSWMVAGVFETG